MRALSPESPSDLLPFIDVPTSYLSPLGYSNPQRIPLNQEPISNLPFRFFSTIISKALDNQELDRSKRIAGGQVSHNSVNFTSQGFSLDAKIIGSQLTINPNVGEFYFTKPGPSSELGGVIIRLKNNYRKRSQIPHTMGYRLVDNISRLSESEIVARAIYDLAEGVDSEEWVSPAELVGEVIFANYENNI